MTHDGALFIREELQTYKSTCQRKKPRPDPAGMHDTNRFVPLYAASPVFSSIHHVIINYADKLPYKSMQLQLLMCVGGEMQRRGPGQRTVGRRNKLPYEVATIQNLGS